MADTTLSSPLWTTVHDVLDPLTGQRLTLRWQHAGGAWRVAGPDAPGGRDIDGAHWWLLPALYDADAHMPLAQFGIRESDRLRALAGGVAQMNVAVPWQVVRGMDLRVLAAECARPAAPRVIPLLSVWPHADSDGFAGWLAAHASALKDSGPAVCKLYSSDPHFERNLEALWAAGIKPMVWCASPEHLEQLPSLAAERALHLRHATSAAAVAVMKRAPAATLQTSPHFLLPARAPGAGPLTVLPDPPPAEDRASLAGVFLDQVDLIASDHVAPHYTGVPASPGLQTQQHFLPALLSLCERHDWPLARVLDKATRAPAEVFGVAPPRGYVLVDPEYRQPVGPWHEQNADRAPFLGMALKGRVLAVAGETGVELV